MPLHLQGQRLEDLLRHGLTGRPGSSPGLFHQPVHEEPRRRPQPAVGRIHHAGAEARGQDGLRQLDEAAIREVGKRPEALLLLEAFSCPARRLLLRAHLGLTQQPAHRASYAPANPVAGPPLMVRTERTV